MCNNLIADLNFDSTKKTVVLSAHYDTTENSLGALDNATGTAAILEVAKNISKIQFNYNIRIIFFSSEEYYLCGSRAYVGSLTESELSNIVGCINVDMVGGKDARKVIIQTSPLEENWLTTEYRRINGDFLFRQAASSDQVPFTQKGIPAIHFTTTDMRDLNFDIELMRKEENLDAVSLQNLQLDVDLLTAWLKNLVVK